MRRLLPVLGAGALALAACGGSSHGSSAPAHAEISVRAVTGVGQVLVDSRGHTLYVFRPDARHAVTCTGECAGIWPPTYTSGAPKAGAGVTASLLGTDPDPSGGTVVTYDGWPLYSYIADVEAGLDAGQGTNLDGGYWYVMAPDGRPIVPPGKPAVAGS